MRRSWSPCRGRLRIARGLLCALAVPLLTSIGCTSGDAAPRPAKDGETETGTLGFCGREPLPALPQALPQCAPTVAAALDAGVMDAGTATGGGQQTCPSHSEQDGGQAPLDGGHAPLIDAAKTRMPRNVIVMMGDGVGERHWAAARVALGSPLALDALQGPVLYHTDSVGVGAVTDSAAAATAMATGQCTTNGAISVSTTGHALTTVLERAQQAGKRAGVVTNTMLVDASPMAFTTHAHHRNCVDDLAARMFVAGPDLMMGGAVPPALFIDGVGLEDRGRERGYRVISAWPPADDDKVSAEPLLGLFGLGPSVIAWPDWSWGFTPEILREPNSDEPTLAQMTGLALSRLARGSDGFFLFVENEHPDTVGHAATFDELFAAELMPWLVLELDIAVAAAIDWIESESSFEETLLVVCSDHENGGYTFDSDDPADISLARFPASPYHTRDRVPVYARGPGSEYLDRVEHISDLYYLFTGAGSALPTSAGCEL